MSRENPVKGVDYKSGCERENCPCQRPGKPRGEFMGLEGWEWCPRCGWHRDHHEDVT